MTDKVLENYVYEGLGFPVELHNVTMVSFGEEFHPHIDVKKVADMTIQSLCQHDKKLTGDQLVFMRTYLMMETKEFAKLIKQSEKEVAKWENTGSKITAMDSKTEKTLKEQVLNQLFVKNKTADKENKDPHQLSAKNLFSDKQKKRKSDAENKEQPTVKKKKP